MKFIKKNLELFYWYNLENKEIYCFFRNDDVRNTLDKELVEITNFFVENEISISHAVEPGNITPEVIKWLIELKTKHPDLIEIIQHGYDHSAKNKLRKGEFGGQRNYEEQFEDIRKGKELMDKYFGDLWFPAFCFPNGSYNFDAIKAVADNKFKVVNGRWQIDLKHKLFYFLGHLIRKELLFNYKIPYNLEYRPKNKIFQININISVINKYLDEETASTMLSLEQLITETKRFMTKKTIGILLHHRYHNTEQKIILIYNYLKWLKTQPYIQFTTIEKIHTKYFQ